MTETLRGSSGWSLHHEYKTVDGIRYELFTQTRVYQEWREVKEEQK